LRSALERAGRLALDFLLPSHCLTCDSPVAEPGGLCPACFEQTEFITPPFCLKCAVPLDESGTDGTCRFCRIDPPPWGEARAALRYNEQSKRIILPLKYGDRIENARALAPMMVRAGASLLHAADWLVPVPLHRRRMISRRYNQAALLAQELTKLSHRKPLLDALRRTRATTPLAEMSPEQRTTEMDRAIAVRPNRVTALNGSRVLLIDDVLTSGATARACVEVLLEAGVTRVDVLAAARVRSRQWDG
jgi:ComF family protein